MFRVFRLTVVAALACDVGGLQNPGGELIWVGPAEVSRSIDFRVAADRAILPKSVNRSTIQLQSGPVTEPLSFRVNPLTNEISIRSFSGAVLEPNVSYILTVNGLLALDGTEFKPLSAVLTTTTTTLPLEEGTADPDAVVALFARHCASCHAEGTDLDLSSSEGIRATARGIPAKQTGEATLLGERGLRGMPRIDVLSAGGRSANSYLIHKVLGTPGIWGTSMPPEGSLSDAELELLAQWIDHGAPTPLP